MNETDNVFYRIKQENDAKKAAADRAKAKQQELPADTSAMLFVYVRETAAGRLVRVLHNDDAAEFEDDDDWVHVASIQPRAFIEQILQDNKAIFDGVFKK